MSVKTEDEKKPINGIRKIIRIRPTDYRQTDKTLRLVMTILYSKELGETHKRTDGTDGRY